MGEQREGDRLGAEGAAQAARGTLAGMESRKTSGNAPAPSGRSKMRPFIVAGRWAVAVAWGVAVVALWPAIPRMFAAFLLAFLLVNALWQHAVSYTHLPSRGCRGARRRRCRRRTTGAR